MSNEDTYNKEAAQTIVAFLESNVPKSDVDNIRSELKSEFVLGKKKGKVIKKKPRRKKQQCLTRKEKKSLGFYRIPRNGVKYQDVLPMNDIWTGYMENLLDLDRIPEYTSKTWECFTQSIYRADFHGAILKVVRSKCPSFVGKTGICIMDTKHTFRIVSKDNIITTIPKKENVFEMYVKHIKFTFFGKHMILRPAERSNKKIRGHFFPDL